MLVVINIICDLLLFDSKHPCCYNDCAVTVWRLKFGSFVLIIWFSSVICQIEKLGPDFRLFTLPHDHTDAWLAASLHSSDGQSGSAIHAHFHLPEAKPELQWYIIVNSIIKHDIKLTKWSWVVDDLTYKKCIKSTNMHLLHFITYITRLIKSLESDLNCLNSQ